MEISTRCDFGDELKGGHKNVIFFNVNITCMYILAKLVPSPKSEIKNMQVELRRKDFIFSYHRDARKVVEMMSSSFLSKLSSDERKRKQKTAHNVS